MFVRESENEREGGRERDCARINVKNLAILKTDEMHGLDIYQNLAQIVEVGLQRIFSLSRISSS